VEGVVNPSAASWRGRRVLVTGHTGFKGGWLWMVLRKLGADVHGIERYLAMEPRAMEPGAP
jgi:CDP-glucose 4,6-dehydratase